jgi:chaperonin cofactor prefoldin
MCETGSTTVATADALETFIETTTDALESLGADDATLSTVEAAGSDLVETAASKQDRLEELETRVEILETQIKSERETRAKEAAEDRKRLHDLETQINEVSSETESESTPDGSQSVDTASTSSTPQVQPPETPLEDVIQIPEHLVESNLTANQRRARFVAKDIHEYTQRVPAGRAIKSAELRRVLAAGEDARIYTETVSRVIEFLDQLGGEAVEVQESKDGQRVIVFTEAIVERIRTHNQRTGSNTVVTHQGVER